MNRKKHYGERYNSYGFEFYDGGIFSFYNIDGDTGLMAKPTYNIVEFFDWRSRHDANVDNTPYYDGDVYGGGWMTPIVCQSGCWYNGEILCDYDSVSCVNTVGGEWRSTGGCTAFSSVAQVEGMFNLYYNQHLDFDLSEQELVSYPDPQTGLCLGVYDGGYTFWNLNYIKNYGIVDELCFPFVADTIPCDSMCEYPTDRITYFDHNIVTKNNDSIKTALINYGPIAFDGLYPYLGNHAAALVGFDVIKKDDILYIQDTIPNSLLGQTYWIFKNAGGYEYGNNGYLYMLLDSFPESAYRLKTPMISMNNIVTDNDRKCYDIDQDGYFNWGLGPKPDTCPECPDQIDGNDNDYSLGPMDEKGFSTIINDHINSFEGHFYGWQQTNEDDLDWWVQSGPTGLGHWGPSSAYDGDYYLYLDSYSSTANYQEAIIKSPPIDLNAGCSYEVGFSYYKYSPWGGTYSKLELQATDDGESWSILWGIYGNTTYSDTTWKQVNFEIPANYNQVRFYAKTGNVIGKNNIGIDKFTITETNNYNQMIIYDIVTWNSEFFACNDIIIDSGAALILNPNCILHMPQSKKIIVKRGGKLELAGGKITNSGQGPWDGVELWGTNNAIQHPSYQGLVKMYDSAVIENAKCGIKTIRPDELDSGYDPDFSGGIVWANNTYFINNGKAVEFYPYSYYNSLSYFNNCNFITDNNLLSNVIFEYYVKLSGIQSIDFKSCSFINSNNFLNVLNRGIGIYSLNSDFLVWSACISGGTPCTEWDSTTFTNMCYGIKALVSGSNEPFTVKNTSFENNLRGIFVSGIDNISVYQNSFQTYELASQFLENYGMYLEECHGYEVEENNFYNPDSEQVRGTGLVVCNSGPEPNNIYNNTFDRFEYGVIVQRENREAGGETGLSIKCNDFTECEYDIAVTGSGESPYLGIKRNQGSNGPNAGDPAGNTFSYTWNNNESDYYNETHNIIYWYHQYDGGYNVKPVKHSKPQVNPLKNNQNQDPFDPETACPSNFSEGTDGGDAGEHRESMASAEEKIDSVQNLLDILVDGGNTEILATEVQNSYPPEAWDLYVSLLGKSPYLSDTVMKNAVNKENVLPPELVTDVLVANPQSAKSDEVLIEVENRTIPLAEEMKEEIMLNWYITGAKESLESKLSAYKAERGEALNRLIWYFRNDTVSPSPQDSIIEILQQENSLWAKYTLAFEYLAKGELILSENVMSDIPVSFTLTNEQHEDYQDQLTYFNILKQLKQEGKGWIDADSIQINALYDFSFDNSEAGAYARNILMFYDTLNYNEEILYPSFLKSGPVIPIPAQPKAEKNSLTVYPNPAHDYFIVRYQLDNSYAEAKIQITDISGKMVKEFNVTTTRDYLIVPVLELSTGMYVVKLILNGQEAGAQKVTIRK